jgi:hypothetical protein
MRGVSCSMCSYLHLFNISTSVSDTEEAPVQTSSVHAKTANKPELPGCAMNSKKALTSVSDAEEAPVRTSSAHAKTANKSELHGRTLNSKKAPPCSQYVVHYLLAAYPNHYAGSSISPLKVLLHPQIPTTIMKVNSSPLILSLCRLKCRTQSSSLTILRCPH